MATASASTPAEEQVKSIYQYKITPPIFDGDYSNFEEWRYKFTGSSIQHFPIRKVSSPHHRQCHQSRSRHHRGRRNLDQVSIRTSVHLGQYHQRSSSNSMPSNGSDIKRTRDLATVGHRLASELQFILVNITKGPAATVCRQMGLTSNGLETWRQLVIRFSIPVGTRSTGYLTKLLKPSFDEVKFEESFATWELEINRYERDNSAVLPDSIKIAVLLNETRGALQQHLQLTASHVTDYQRIRTIIIEYYRAAASFSRMQQLNGHQPQR